MKQSRRGTWAIAVTLLLFCLAAPHHLAAQSGTGTLTGTVVDGQGASVPGALVEVTEQATGATRNATSDGDGSFRLAGLPAGLYTIDVSLTGFAPVRMTSVPLAPAEVRSLERVQLKVGQLTETVTVAANTAAVQTATSSRMGTVTAEQLTNLPMKGRDIWGLMAVVPGVQDTNMGRNFTTWTSMAGITINGMPNTAKVVVMDGVNIIDELGTNAMVNPNIDAVGEVQVISNGFTAENGRSSGGLIIMTTKSGTNQIRGSGWYNARRTEWTANEYFRKKQNLGKPLYHVNIPGYSIGGPILIPKVVPRGKAFFFVSQEYTDDLRASTPSRVNYPTALERQGDFSQTYFGTASGPGQGTLQVITDPLTGQPFPGNRIPADRINALGQKLLNLLPMPNNIYNPQPGQYNAANSTYETLPLHSRTNTTLRFDVVHSSSLRGSYRFIKDREDNISNNAFAPGIGVANNAVPGYISTGGLTMVLGNSIVNEMTSGFAHNSYSWIPGTGDHFEDYRQYYRSAAGVDPPRLEPFASYSDPQQWGYAQADQYPYLPTMNYTGGSRTALANFNPASAAGRILPAANRNDRWSFQNDLSWTVGRHNLKFGVSTEWASKTEPLSPDYRGNYLFGHDAQNPLSTGNGYANALLGAFTTYTELTDRVDRDRRHWYTEGYAQDSWRMKPGFTLDYGVRMTHTGGYYDTRQSTAGFYEPGWDARQAPRLYVPVCTTGVAGNVACPANSQRAVDPANPSALLPSAFVGNLVPGSGSQINGMRADGYPGLRPGEYFKFPSFVAAPRVGFAWDINGDGKQALRASGGTFYAVPTRGFQDAGWEQFVGVAPSAFTRVVRWATFSDIENFATSGKSFVETPIDAVYAGGETRSLERSYNLNVTYQRDIGFNTTAEVAYVGSWAYSGGRAQDINRPVNNLYLYGNPNNLFNGNAKATNLLRTEFPGLGSVQQWFDEKDGFTVNNNILRYHSMQLNVQRRLNRGLQMGMAYTLAKGEGWNGYSPEILEADPTGELNRLKYWGPTSNNRVHNLVVNYSYIIPNALPNTPVAKWIFDDWQIAGVTRFMSGQATQPTCTSNNTGIANTNPTLTPGWVGSGGGGGAANRTWSCMLTGEPVFEVTRDPNLAEEDQLHFNPRAFAMPQPLSATVGNFGNVPLGILRHPSFWNWDLTLSRGFSAKALGANAQARVQLQLYNIFNTAQFTNLNTALTFQDDPNVPGVDNLLLTSTQHGRYTAPAGQAGTNPPRQFGLTVRLDF
jgi:hypothetical protein